MSCDDQCYIVDPPMCYTADLPTLVPFDLPADMRELVEKRMTLIEGLMARSMVDLGYPPGALTLYEESKPVDGMGTRTLHKWWVGVDTTRTPVARPGAIIKNFLVKAAEFYDAELARLTQEYRDNPDSAHAKKAVEGARWTKYHTKTLLNLLEQKGPML